LHDVGGMAGPDVARSSDSAPPEPFAMWPATLLHALLECKSGGMAVAEFNRRNRRRDADIACQHNTSQDLIDWC